jgi:glycosyltransferase involved in cell wall biosynthesis
MTIAVNTRFLLPQYLEGYGYFIYETFKRITHQHSEHKFIFIFDRNFDERFVFSTNIIPVVTGPPARYPLLWKWWYDVKVPAVLRKYKADVFVSCDGFCSLTTKTPQCLVVHDLAFLHYPSFIKRSHLSFYKKYTKKFLYKANSVATVSAFSKQEIISEYKIKADKIDIVGNAVKSIFRPLTNEEKQLTRDKYTDSKEYFVYAGSIHPRKNLQALLKAFSVFKRRQQSNLKLVLVGRLAWKYDSFIKDLKTYKYKNDVVITGYLDEAELVNVIGSAYAMVYTSLFEGFGVPVLEAMRCEIPVITSAGSSMEEISKGAALLADAKDHEDIADKMIRLYKDEDLRNDLIKKGKLATMEFSWEKTGDLMWECILKACNSRNKTFS